MVHFWRENSNLSNLAQNSNIRIFANFQVNFYCFRVKLRLIQCSLHLSLLILDDEVSTVILSAE